MAVLTAQRRAELRAEFAEELSRERETCGVIKGDVLAAIVALDDWFDNNAATLNQQIPQPARSNLTTEQKARLLRLLLQWRYIDGA